MDNNERILELVCDKLCKYPSEFHDPDELWQAVCDRCPLSELLEETND